MPASATASQAYSSGARSNAPTPPSAASTTPLVSTANSASDEPATTASSTAATAPDQIRAPSTHNTNAGPITRATTAQVSSGARCWSDVGLPTATMTATESGQRRCPEPLPSGYPVMGNPRVDRQREQQHRHLQRGHQHHRARGSAPRPAGRNWPPQPRRPTTTGCRATTAGTTPMRRPVCRRSRARNADG